LDNEAVVMPIFWVIMTLPLLIIVLVVLTEIAVHRRFDKNGKPY